MGEEKDQKTEIIMHYNANKSAFDILAIMSRNTLVRDQQEASF
jgi:hypothetical protein